MSPESIGLIGVLVLMVLLAARMWVGLATAVIGFLGILFVKGSGPAIQACQTPYIFVAKYDLAVIPMFLLMGMFIYEAGIAGNLFNTAHKWIGQVRGGLALATVAATAFFAAVTGTSVSGVVVMSKVALPEMQKYHYADSLSVGVIASAATMGILIPPSIGFIMYGILTEQSIGELFMAGLIPGVLEAIFYIVTIYILCRFNPKLGPPGPATSLKEKIFSLKNTWAVVALFLLIMGGIYGGVFTPTEAGAIGAIGAIVIAIIDRQLSREGFLRALRETGLITCMILLMLMGISIFQKFMAVSELPFWIGNVVIGLKASKMVIIIAIVIIYVILGSFLPIIETIMITIPIIYPVILVMGFNPIWFGVVMVRMMEIGGITPPFGLGLLTLSAVSGISLSTIYRGVIPFVIADLFHVALLIAVPAISLFLPSTM